MKVAFWCIGATDEKYLSEGINGYIKSLSNYLSFEYKEIPFRRKNASTPEQHREAEKEAILKLLKPTDRLILLDEKGKTFSSPAFADHLQKQFNNASGKLVFLSGGPFGFHNEISARAAAKISLSPMTFTHQMVRLIFLEQLYRAMTILRNEPYHHGE